jgi:hypothetical protein
MAMAAANWIMSAAETLYLLVQSLSLVHMPDSPAFSARLHSEVRIRLPSQPLLIQSWKGARMAPWASAPQPSKEDWRSVAIVFQTVGQEDWRGRILRAEAETVRKRRVVGRANIVMNMY